MDVLLDSAEGSGLLVFGRCSSSGLTHSALGSVGETCERLASYPVAIVPPPVAAQV